MRVLTNPAETGAVTLALPQDAQVEAYDYPKPFFEKRVWRVTRPVPDAAELERAAELIRGSRRPMIVAGGGVIYSESTEALRRLCERTGIPVGETQAGKGSVPYDHPLALGPWARRAPSPPTAPPARPTSSSESAPAGATSPPPLRRPSKTLTYASSTSKSPTSTPTSTRAWAPLNRRGLICLAAFFFVLLLVPVTRGRSLEEIESDLLEQAATA
jgi:hypothetical protein